ncbi:unnamed protein product [Microthlaspi erraticum]|uniref:MYB transcription factor n=1 Tax=Microthlaspi erraticum TaxID=1685480 RepID=A0A6D2L8L0_9BRAS|nr:unnamed protein product [Microthlaspi erraticum]
MGGPKQKWTYEEEMALRAGVVKHGPGKWRAIVLDSQFRSALKYRTNVDLKDKWRNLNVSGGGSRKKSKPAQKKTRSSRSKKNDDNDTDTDMDEADGDDAGQEIVPTPPPSPPSGSVDPPTDFDGPYASVDKMIVQGINISNDGLDRNLVLRYIEMILPDMKNVVTSRLKYLTNAGTLLKINGKYKMPPGYQTAGAEQMSPPQLQNLLEENMENTPNPEENGVQSLTNGVLDKTMGMTVEEAAAAAARAVAEADFAIAEAEAAAREADEAEAAAEAAQIFAEVAMEFLKCSMHGQAW